MQPSTLSGPSGCADYAQRRRRSPRTPASPPIQRLKRPPPKCERPWRGHRRVARPALRVRRREAGLLSISRRGDREEGLAELRKQSEDPEAAGRAAAGNPGNEEGWPKPRNGSAKLRLKTFEENVTHQQAQIAALEKQRADPRHRTSTSPYKSSKGASARGRSHTGIRLRWSGRLSDRSSPRAFRDNVPLAP
jgi:hypothetical protein